MFCYRDRSYCADSTDCGNGECSRHLVHLRHNYQELPVSWGKFKTLPHRVKDKLGEDEEDHPGCGYVKSETMFTPGDVVEFHEGITRTARSSVVLKCGKRTCDITFWDNGHKEWVLYEKELCNDLKKVGTVATPPKF